MGFQLSGASDPPSVIQMICFLSISGPPVTTIAIIFGIFTESTLLNHLQLIAQENRYQHLDCPGSSPAQYISTHRGIRTLSKQYRVDVSYPTTRVA
jgi:hypothetical protein